MRTRSVWRSLCASLVAAAVFGACGTGGVEVSDISRVRVANALAANRAVDFLIDGRVVASAVGAGGGTEFVMVEPGTHIVTLRATGTSEVLLTDTTDVVANTDVTLVAAGSGVDARAITLVDDAGGPVPTTPLVRFVNAAPGPALDLFVGPVEFDVGTSTAPPTASNVPFGGSTAFIEVPFGPSRVVFTATGTRTAIGTEPFTNDFAVGASTIVVTPPSGASAFPGFLVLPGSTNAP